MLDDLSFKDADADYLKEVSKSLVASSTINQPLHRKAFKLCECGPDPIGKSAPEVAIQLGEVLLDNRGGLPGREQSLRRRRDDTECANHSLQRKPVFRVGFARGFGEHLAAVLNYANSKVLGTKDNNRVPERTSVIFTRLNTQESLSEQTPECFRHNLKEV